MAILCTQRSCASHVEMFQYASEKNVDKWAIFRYAHYKIRKKNSPWFSVAVYNFSMLDGEKFLFDKKYHILPSLDAEVQIHRSTIPVLGMPCIRNVFIYSSLFTWAS